MPGPRVDEIFEPLPDGHPATLVDLLGRKAGLLDFLTRGLDLGLDLAQFLGAGRGAFDASRLQLLAEAVHFLEIRFHTSLNDWACARRRSRR